MMKADVFSIYIEQLRGGIEEKIDETLDPSFLDIHEDDLRFTHSVQLSGCAYLADSELVLHWNVHTIAQVPCTICNEQIALPIKIENFYACEPVDEIKSGVFNFKDLLRETILLEIPHFVECRDGKCPKREEYRVYLKKSSDLPAEEEGYHPFADLDWKS